MGEATTGRGGFASCLHSARPPVGITRPHTLAAHQKGILNYYDYPISTGPLEGTNTKIQRMKRQAYGYRNHKFFKLKILGLHETHYALVG